MSNDPSWLRRQIWNRLPVFLEVAETGSIGAAAKRLGLTRAAVSRTLRLLQEEVGSPLFNREGRRLILNSNGLAFQRHLRQASSAVEEGLSEMLDDAFVGRLSVASLGVLTERFVVPSLIALKAAHPDLVPEHRNITTREANAALVRGEVHVAFYYEALTAEDVTVQKIGEAGASIYCGIGHPLFGAEKITRERVLEHPFSVPQIGDSGLAMDGWPTDVQRAVGMRITMLRTNLDVCLSGLLLTVLPDVTAAPHVAERRLRRLPVVVLPRIEFYAARHARSAERGAAALLVDEVRQRIAEAGCRQPAES